jgi:hypothetical protein
MDLQIRVQSVAREGLDDEALGEQLVRLVRGAQGRGSAAAAAVVVGAERIDIVPLAPIVQARMRPAWFVAGLSRSPFGEVAPDAVGLIGTFRYRRGPDDPGAPIALSFLEWTDCRWWEWRALIDGTALRDDTETVRRAVDGVPRPDGLGGWWSLGRRRGVAFRWRRSGAPVLVH